MSSVCCIIDYGMGNVGSVANAIGLLGYSLCVSDRRGDIAASDVVILPGVGAFGQAMHNLRERGLVPVLEDVVRRGGKPFLGICAGMQVIARTSDEEGMHEGLGWLSADVRRIAPANGLRVPHVGWNTMRHQSENPAFGTGATAETVFFDHSYAMVCDDPSDVAATVDYGGSVVAAVRRDNIYATQFHPEKSQVVGLKMLRRWFDGLGITRS